MKTKRQLAAILFADIQGYTALMQKDEQTASTLLRHFQQQLEEKVSTFNGRIVNFYGDGALCTFQIPIDAVRCGMALQTTFNTTPKTPVRIGIHSGTVTLEGDKIFGDSVNITSRIESMGVAGGILVSKKVRDEVKNNPDLEMISLGSFEFKNVEEPMEVFALANEGFIVPQKDQLKGKIKTTSDQKKTTPLLNVFKIILPLLLVGVGMFWYFFNPQHKNTSQLLPKDVLEERVAIGIFSNHTGEDQLDALGFLASEWLTASLREINIKTVSPEMVRKYNDYIGVLPDNPENKASFAEITGAQYVVSGSYFLNKDSIRLISRLLSTNNGEEIQSLPEVVLPKNQKEQIVETLRERLLGFWSVRASKDLPNIKPPTYEAYQTYLTCVPGAIHCYLKVLKQDSTFLLAHTNMMYDAVWWENEQLYNRSKTFVQNHWHQCTEFEKKYFNLAKHFWENNYPAAFEIIDDLYKEFPQNIILIHESAWLSMACLNNPYLATERYEELFNRIELYQGKLWVTNFSVYMYALNQLGRHKEVIQFAETIPTEYRKEKDMVWRQRFIAHLNVNQKEEAIKLVEDIMANSDNHILYNEAYYYWNIRYRDSIPNPFLEPFKKQLESFQESMIVYTDVVNHKSKAYAYYQLGNYQEAEKNIKLILTETDWEKTFEDPIVRIPMEEGTKLLLEGLLGSIYARQGNLQEALKQLKRLDELRATQPKHNNPVSRGMIPYNQARIHAILGNKEEAVKLLRQSIKAGRAFIGGSFTYDYDLLNLRGYEPFEELIAPRRFPVKD